MADGGSPMPREYNITIFLPNGERLRFIRVKGYSVSDAGTLIVSLEGADATIHGDELLTNLPFLIEGRK